ncbi:MAG: Trm112 family protein [Chloroflexi bacterium]|nr:Trm112 family protein [Chloroflexota bacterium]
MVSPELLEILVCPYCKTKVDLMKRVWLVCRNPECRRKYPIRDDIPIMLVEEGDKYRDIAVEQLPTS